MEQQRFDHLTRAVSSVLSRRSLTRVLGLGALGLPVLSDAKKKRKRKKKKKVTFNAFGCVNVGGFCKNSGQCCSGICQGKKGKKKCKAHDGGSCQAGQDSCAVGGSGISCTTDAGIAGFCVITTGDAAYCAREGDCHACTRDTDCVPFCGSQAACIVCAGCTETGGTACDGATSGACTFPESS